MLIGTDGFPTFSHVGVRVGDNKDDSQSSGLSNRVEKRQASEHDTHIYIDSTVTEVSLRQ